MPGAICPAGAAGAVEDADGAGWAAEVSAFEIGFGLGCACSWMGETSVPLTGFGCSPQPGHSAPRTHDARSSMMSDRTARRRNGSPAFVTSDLK